MAISSKNRRKAPKNGEENPEIDVKAALAAKRAAKLKRQQIIFFAVGAIASALILGLPLSLIFDPKIGIAAGLGLPLLVFSFLYPKTALWLFLIYLPFGGTVVYWIGGGSPVLQLAKDFIYLPALLGLIWQCRQQRLPILIIPKFLQLTLGIFILCLLLTLLVVNVSFQMIPECSELVKTGCREPGIPIAQGLLGLKVYLGYIPLIFCAYYLIEDKKTVFFLGRLLVVLAIICCALGILQYWYLETGRCKGTREAVGDLLFKASLEARCLVGGALQYSPQVNTIRLPGTFVSPWHWAWFLVGNAGICFASAFSDPSKLWRLLGLTGLGLVFINAVISGQRLALLMVPALVVILLVLTGKIGKFKQFIPIALILGLILFIGFSFLNPDFIQARIDSFVGRWNQSPPYIFALNQLSFALRYGGLIGRGVGYGTASARVFGEISFIETYHSKVLFELGMIGFIGYMTFLTALIYATFKAYRSLKDPALRSFAASFWVVNLVITYLPYWYALDTDPICVYYWLFTGVILRLPAIEKEEKNNPLPEEVQSQATAQAKFKRKKFSLA